VSTYSAPSWAIQAALVTIYPVYKTQTRHVVHMRLCVLLLPYGDHTQ